jgi:hypothetical protein
MDSMARVLGAVAVTVVLPFGALAACGGDDDAEPAAADVTTTTRERGLTVCAVEQEVDLVEVEPSSAGDFAAQSRSAVAFLDEILAVRARGRPPTDIVADYESVTEAYQVVRDAFAAATGPDDYITKVQDAALEEFGTRQEVDRFMAAYTAWVQTECGFDPQLGITLFTDGP